MFFKYGLDVSPLTQSDLSIYKLKCLKKYFPIALNVLIDIGKNFEICILEIYDMQGQLLIQQPILQNNSVVDISKLEKGMYIVRVNSEKGFDVKRFVKD